MSTLIEPLANVKDHPCVILANSDTSRLLDETINPSKGEESRTLLFDQADEATVQDCINMLRLYEQGHGVTFVALDTATLAEVRKRYEKIGNREEEAVNVAHFIGEVADLLGLND
jgi:hypothetical protein